MLGRARTYSRIGMHCEPVVVETDMKRGLPTVLFTGVLAPETREARERIRPALINSGFDFPLKRITVNFSPADTPKSGTHCDLAIAVSIMAAQKQVDIGEEAVFFGELSLGGDVKWVRGILPLIMDALSDGYKKIFVPFENVDELAHVDTSCIFPLRSLAELKTVKKLIPMSGSRLSECESPLCSVGDYGDIKGQAHLVSAFIVAAAGQHHMLIIGPPGSGKTMCADRLSGVMPELTEQELLEVNMIYSVAAENPGGSWISQRPFRAPHTNASTRAMIGGGPKVLPGEVSLSHKGVLFLDEFLEFHTNTLQSLRTILEKKEVHISLRNGYSVYPADFLLIAAANPCPCGYFDTAGGVCSCSHADVKRYRKKLRNPLTDRIDIQVKTERVNYRELTSSESRGVSSSADIKELIRDMRSVQSRRFYNEHYLLNSMIPADQIKQYCPMTPDAETIIERVAEDNILSARACHKVLKLARTTADINGHAIIDDYDLLDALSMRCLDIDRTLI